MLFSVLTHIRANVISGDRSVLEYGLHLGEVFAKVVGNADVAFNHTKYSAVDYSYQNFILSHGPFRTVWLFRFELPLTFPHLDYVR